MERITLKNIETNEKTITTIKKNKGIFYLKIELI